MWGNWQRSFLVAPLQWHQPHWVGWSFLKVPTFKGLSMNIEFGAQQHADFSNAHQICVKHFQFLASQWVSRRTSSLSSRSKKWPLCQASESGQLRATAQLSGHLETVFTWEVKSQGQYFPIDKVHSCDRLEHSEEKGADGRAGWKKKPELWEY